VDAQAGPAGRSERNPPGKKNGARKFRARSEERVKKANTCQAKRVFLRKSKKQNQEEVVKGQKREREAWEKPHDGQDNEKKK